MPRRRPAEPKMPEHLVRINLALQVHREACGIDVRFRPMVDGLRCSKCDQRVVVERVEELLGG